MNRYTLHITLSKRKYLIGEYFIGQILYRKVARSVSWPLVIALDKKTFGYL